MNEMMLLITAAGGNGTVMQVIDAPLSRQQYADQGRALGLRFASSGAEQAGFLIPSAKHFEMAGGEFCGNAARAAAIPLSNFGKQPNIVFTVSGFNGLVHAIVNKLSEKTYKVQCNFPGMPVVGASVTLASGQPVTIVDLGGIVHVVIDDTFPSRPSDYEQAHFAITTELRLREREAVGVLWLSQVGEDVTMHPVVWVKAVDTFFYETSCGSGTIAASKVTGSNRIKQPSGKYIEVEVTNDTVALASEMEIQTIA